MSKHSFALVTIVILFLTACDTRREREREALKEVLIEAAVPTQEEQSMNEQLVEMLTNEIPPPASPDAEHADDMHERIEFCLALQKDALFVDKYKREKLLFEKLPDVYMEPKLSKREELILEAWDNNQCTFSAGVVEAPISVKIVK